MASTASQSGAAAGGSAPVAERPDQVRNVVLVGHNPGIEGLADILSGTAEEDARERMTRRGFPAAAFAVLTLDGSWKSLEPGAATLVDYWAPSE